MSSLVKVVLKDEAEGVVETLWAEPRAEGGYVLENAPFYVPGYSYGDVVDAQPAADGRLVVRRVIERGGRATLWVFLTEPVTCYSDEWQRRWEELARCGARFEGASDQYLSIDVPPDGDLQEIVSLLERGQADEIWHWAEGFRPD